MVARMDRPAHRRGFHVASEKQSFDGSALTQYDRTVYFDDNQGYDLEGLEHDIIKGCAHCDIKLENYSYVDRNLRAGVAFAKYLDMSAPPAFVHGMKMWLAGVDPFVTEN